MKLTLIGYWKNTYYEESLKIGLEENNIKVDKLVVKRTTKYQLFTKSNELELIVKIKNLDNKILLFWQCNEISKNIFIKLIKLNFKIIQYHNDNPFNYNSLVRFFKFYKYRDRIDYCDLVFYYRKNDKKYLKKYNTKYELLPPYYNSELHYVSNLKIKHDIIFIGHYEKDNRDEFINFLYDNNINIFIGGSPKSWEVSKVYLNIKKKIKPLFEDKYRIEINKSHLGICFLSKINKDEYTRRCFELPACGTPILMPKTNQLVEIFGDMNQFYNTKEELLELTKFYLKNSIERNKLLKWQKKIVENYEVKHICKNLSKKILRLDEENNLKILFHHPSLTTYRLFYFQKISKFYSNIKFIFNYNNLKKINNLKNSKFISEYEWKGTKGSLIFNKILIKKPTNDLLITSDHVNLPEMFLFFTYLIYNKKIFVWSAINERVYKKKNLIKKIYLQFIYNKCDLILCINSQNKKFINNRFKNNKSVILPNTTINFSDYFNTKNKDYSNRTFNINNNYKNILYVGRIEESKGIIMLLEALNELGDYKFNLILVGKNYISKQKLNKYKKINLFIFNEVEIEELKKFYSIADVFIFPSLEDTWGMVINEIFSYNCVVICSKNAGCYPDLANEENSLCFDSQNLNQLISYIKKSLEYKERYIFRENKDKKLYEFSLNNQIQILNNAINKFL